MSSYDVPFPYVNHSAVDISQLNAIYNRCAAGLILSLTNMSLLPMEVMGSGVVPVVNDAENTRGVFDSPLHRVRRNVAAGHRAAHRLDPRPAGCRRARAADRPVGRRYRVERSRRDVHRGLRQGDEHAPSRL
ncbi:MAG: hypothetical protein WDM88_06685 [Galbitalea sp.]